MSVKLYIVIPITAIFLQIASAKDTLSVFFIGNSLTNSVPDPLTLMINSSDTWVNMKWTAELWGGSTLQFHWDSLHAQDSIKNGKYDYVVFQDAKQPSFFVINDTGYQNSYTRWCTKYANAVHQAGDEAIIYCTMGFKGDPLNMYDTLIKYELKAATNTNCILAPVAAVAKQAISEDTSINLWSDGIHNNALGVYLVACTFYCVFTGESPVGCKVHGSGTDTVSASQALWAQNMAWKVMSQQYPQYLNWIKSRRTNVISKTSADIRHANNNVNKIQVTVSKSGTAGLFITSAKGLQFNIRGCLIDARSANMAR